MSYLPPNNISLPKPLAISKAFIPKDSKSFTSRDLIRSFIFFIISLGLNADLRINVISLYSLYNPVSLIPPIYPLLRGEKSFIASSITSLNALSKVVLFCNLCLNKFSVPVSSNLEPILPAIGPSRFIFFSNNPSNPISRNVLY